MTFLNGIEGNDNLDGGSGDDILVGNTGDYTLTMVVLVTTGFFGGYGRLHAHWWYAAATI